ncbi:MAG: L,D-transpeptidase family protein [Nitrospirae bacterium]|nr:L,D-transpeptidase family protein [Nitrospirota bacterium]
MRYFIPSARWAVLTLLCFSLYAGSAFPSFVQADKVLVIKSKRLLLLLQNGSILRQYEICIGRNPVGHKTRQGDNKTPEGNYVLDSRNPKSRFHLSLHISYPDKADSINARQSGVSPGGSIMIHGFPKGITMDDLGPNRDWTKGCIAVSNSAIEEIWQLVPDKTPIEILP